MKRIMGFVKRNGLTMLSFLGLVVGSMASTTQTLFYTHQVQCPEELLK